MTIASPLSLDLINHYWPDHISRFKGGPRSLQATIFEFAAGHGSCIIEGPTGLGKSAVEYTLAHAAASQLGGPVFWVAPTRALVGQIASEFPNVIVAYGRNEHPCLWAAEEFTCPPSPRITRQEAADLQMDPDALRVSEVANSVCQRCPHYVDPQTGKTARSRTLVCSYYQQRWAVSQADVVLCTMSFYLFSRGLSRANSDDGPCTALVIDEVHRLAEVVRFSLSYEITDSHLVASIDLLSRLGQQVETEVEALKKFLRAFRRLATARGRKSKAERLLDDDELERLINILDPIDTDALDEKVTAAISRGVFQLPQDQSALRQIEILARDLRRYTQSFQFSLDQVTKAGHTRPRSSFTCSFFTEDDEEDQSPLQGDRRRRPKRSCKLVVHCAHVAPLVRSRLLAPLTFSLSATIGDAGTFGFITGIKAPILRLESDFPIKSRRIYTPTDTLNLSFRSSSRNKPRALRQIARSCSWLGKKGFRSLVIVVSEDERARFMRMAREESLQVATYGNGATPRETLAHFRDSADTTLLGTGAHFGMGIDLPHGTAPVIFLLRPGNPIPHSPEETFRRRRFGDRGAWRIANYSVQQQIAQAVGRNIRCETDRGVTICVDSRFRESVYPALPHWLRPAYQGELTLEKCLEDAVRLLRPSPGSA
jgi:Rad3-related DNA helicase